MAVMLNGAGEKHARSLIDAGKVNRDDSWAFDASDGDAMLGPSGDDWGAYSKWFLGVDPEVNNETREHYKYPIGKGGDLYRSALIAIRQRASQQDATGIYDAAGKLITQIDGGKSSGRTLATKSHLSCGFEIKSVGETGVFSGYGSVYGVEDDGCDIVAPGAFAQSLKDWKAKGRMPALLWQHNCDEPIGVYTSITEDDHGLSVEGQLALKTQRGAEAYELLQMKAISGLSIGFLTRADSWDQKTGVRTIMQADLWECSLVTFPMNDLARVDSVKSLAAVTDFKSAEAYLRDAGGFSRSEATAIVARLKSLIRRDADEETEAKRVIAALMQRQEMLRTSV
jgi:hypothetical protein